RLRQLRSASLEGFRKDDPVCQRNTVGVALHVVQGGSAQAGLAAVRLASTDLKCQSGDAVEQPLGRQGNIVDLRVQFGQVSNQRVGVFPGVGAVGPEQGGFDAVKAVLGVRPGVDLSVEIGNEAAGEDLRALPADSGLDPGPLGAIEVVSFKAV